MSITEKYIEVIKPSLSSCQKKKFRDGMGWTLACPFCRDAQKRESKSNEKCASLYPVEGTFTYFFSCNRGLNGGVQGVQSCNHTMRSLRLNAIRQLAKMFTPPRAGFFIALCHGSIQLVQLMPHWQHLYVLYDLSGHEQLGLNRPDC